MRTASFDLVLVGYRAEHTRSAMRFCDGAFQSAGAGRRLLVMNGPSAAQDAAAPPGWITLRGSNSLAEFSGWQEGLEHLQSADPAPRDLLFVNDTVCTHRHFTSARSLAFALARRRARQAHLTGFQDSVPGGALGIGGLPLDAWVSTYCFVLSTEALRLLNGRLFDRAAVDACVPGGEREDGFFSRMSPDLERHLRHWLFDGAWYGGSRLTRENQARLTLKARCIAAELLLSARCRAHGVRLVDPFREYPWLAGCDRLQRRVARLWRHGGG